MRFYVRVNCVQFRPKSFSRAIALRMYTYRATWSFALRDASPRDNVSLDVEKACLSVIAWLGDKIMQFIYKLRSLGGFGDRLIYEP